MKRFSIYSVLSATLLILSAVSCVPDSLQADGSYITLSISSRTVETKATQNGVDDLNENNINDVYYFFFKKGETESAPVINGRLVGLDQKGTSTRTEEIPVASDAASTLFASIDSCHVFIVANPPKSMESTLKGTPTLKELHAMKLKTTLKGTQESFTMVFDSEVKQSAATGNIMTVEADMQRLASKMTFAMNTAKTCTDMGSTWTSDPDKAKVTFVNAYGQTNLAGDFEAVKNSDDKYSESYFDSDTIAFTEKTVKDKDTWNNKAEKPAYSYPQKWDYAGSKEPYVLIELPWSKSGAASPVTYYYKIFLDDKELKMNTWSDLTINIDELGSTTADDPKLLLSDMNYLVLNWNDAFESSEGITANVDDARYLMLNETEFWIYDQNSWDIPYTSSHECIIVPESETFTKMDYRDAVFERNPNPIASSTLGADYSCTPLGSIVTFKHTLNNIIESYYTSGGIKYGDYDVVAYDFKFTIQHKDDPSYSQEVTVHQYPAIYIEAQTNTKGATVYAPCSNATTFLNIDSRIAGIVDDPRGYSYGRYYGYGGDPQVSRAGSSLPGNKNGNMYVITTTAAPELYVDDAKTKKYMLGDPRRTTISEIKYYKEAKLSGDPYPLYDPVPRWDYDKDPLFTEEMALYMPEEESGTTRTLKYYYQSRTDQAVENIIAPKIRVASSWGAANTVSAKKAIARCAAYQEDGYPAGRWRVPTAAEILYIIRLSSDHIIPMLFGTASDADNVASNYWCSTGYVSAYRTVDENGVLKNANPPKYTYLENVENTTQRNSIRCVYDEWYWEKMDGKANTNFETVNGRMPEGTTTIGGTPVNNYNIRVWGDMPR